MGVSAVVAVGAAATLYTSKESRDAAKKADKKQEQIAEQELKREKATEKAAAAREKKLNAAKSQGTAASARIAAERSYIRKGRRGRMASIKGGTMLG